MREFLVKRKGHWVIFVEPETNTEVCEIYFGDWCLLTNTHGWGAIQDGQQEKWKLEKVD